MPLIQCPDCRKKVSSKAPSCPNCGRPFKKTTSDNSSGIGCLGWTFLIAVGVIIFSLWYDGSGGGGSSSYEPAHDKIDAWTVTQQFVEDELKSPSTAEFPYMSDVDVKQNGKTYTIDGYVDAENSFGANIRQNFVATVRFDGGNNWTLINLEFE